MEENARNYAMKHYDNTLVMDNLEQLLLNACSGQTSR